MSAAPLAVVIPALDEAGRLPLLLADLARGCDLIAELQLVDGGSSDGTPAVARLGGARLLHSPPSRGLQLQRGIAASSAPWLWLLHADARLPPNWPQRLRQLMAAAALRPAQGPLAWYGSFRVDQGGLHYRLLERLVACRSALLQRPYGDQGLLIRRVDLLACGGISPLPLMEDLDFAERFSRGGRWRPMGLEVTVSGRRWRRLGLLPTAWRNAQLRRDWRRGTSAQALWGRYQR
ncbi:MAG: TIGR04283 family arsenosugar biosynthesis glycosyltransferase [Cyanobacteriota bacterium]|nr:TIGR04283 family arsenosugar biosynthesis glycosyltransferase [Cyanobacteriota bacterium]